MFIFKYKNVTITHPVIIVVELEHELYNSHQIFPFEYLLIVVLHNIQSLSFKHANLMVTLNY
jgi:hypothetical protein